MASFINKAKDKIEATLERSQNKGDNPKSDNYGSHGSNMANKTDPTVDSDLDRRNNPTSRVGGYGNTQAPDQYGQTHGPGGVATSDTYGSRTKDPGYDHPQSSNAGPHSSNVANSLDPRVDSGRDERNDPTSRVGGYGATQHHGDNYGQVGGPGGLGTTDTGYSRHTATGPTGYGEPATGQHGLPGQQGYGNEPVAVAHEGHHGHHGHHGYAQQNAPAGGLAANTTTGLPTAGSGNNYDNPQSGNVGPHKSNVMNKLDPRVDSDVDNRNDPTSRVGNYGTQGDNYGHQAAHHGGPPPMSGQVQHGDNYGQPPAHHGGPPPMSGQTGYGDNYGRPTGAAGYEAGGDNYGHTAGIQGGPDAHAGYGSGQADYGRGGYDNSSFTPGSGEATKTAGPHDSNIMNKLDPRVDSDADGSKTYGGNQTFR